MDGFYVLCILALGMLAGSYLAGLVPLVISLSESRMRVVSLFGAGLLVGTALAVIIPEGVETLYASRVVEHPHAEHIPSSVSVERAPPPAPPQPQNLEAKQLLEGNADFRKKDGAAPELPRIIPPDAQLNKGLQQHADEESKPRAKRQVQKAVLITGHSHEEHEEEVHLGGAIGWSLVIGFVFMLLVDQLSASTTASKSDRHGRARVSLTATIGLVVHAAADGVALGSASSIGRSDVQFLVFMAIMLHKGPSAFGLVSFLLAEGLDRARARRYLVVFSLSAPLSALVTYTLLSNNVGPAGTESRTGILLLFSGGTFLYVATVHVLPELTNRSRSSHSDLRLPTEPSSSQANALSHGHSHGGGGADFSVKELSALIAGCVLPAVMAAGHSHQH